MYSYTNHLILNKYLVIINSFKIISYQLKTKLTLIHFKDKILTTKLLKKIKIKINSYIYFFIWISYNQILIVNITNGEHHLQPADSLC